MASASTAPSAAMVWSQAVISLRGQGARSILALLGIVIGAASIVALLNMGHISRLEALNRFERMGVDSLQVSTVSTALLPKRCTRPTRQSYAPRRWPWAGGTSISKARPPMR
jgi:putative ABC transport system permease protein